MPLLGWIATGLHGLFAITAGLNLVFMRRPSATGNARVLVLIPARDEAGNLDELLPLLKTQDLDVAVFDDESTDGTGNVATRHGATVLKPDGPLLEGWTGKNRATHALGLHALTTDAERFVFLDADVRPADGFGDYLRATPGDLVVTGIPRVVPGEGPEPLVMMWVGWAILALNPFWIVSLTGLSHNRFLNGQFSAWPREIYAQIDPWSAMRGRIMEDVAVGRLLARKGVRVRTDRIADLLSVRMYRTWRETLDGFSKNAYEITGSALGTFLFAAFLLGLIALAFATPWATAAFFLGAFFVARLAATPLWPVVFAPIGLMIGAATLVRSWWWRRTGRVRWKGRVYAP